VNTLELYRDDGPILGWVLRRLGWHDDRWALAWLVPPLVRALEYGYVVALTAFVDRDALPAAFAFLFVLAFHHYDLVYRFRQQRTTPPEWLRVVGLGSEGRMALLALFGVAGVLLPGLVALSVVLGLTYVTESTLGWIRFGRGLSTSQAQDDDELEPAE
jgi:Family of unknown function (DUF5941)